MARKTASQNDEVDRAAPNQPNHTAGPNRGSGPTFSAPREEFACEVVDLVHSSSQSSHADGACVDAGRNLAEETAHKRRITTNAEVFQRDGICCLINTPPTPSRNCPRSDLISSQGTCFGFWISR